MVNSAASLTTRRDNGLLAYVALALPMGACLHKTHRPQQSASGVDVCSYSQREQSIGQDVDTLAAGCVVLQAAKDGWNDCGIIVPSTDSEAKLARSVRSSAVRSR